MNWIKDKILKILLRIIQSVNGGLRIVIANRAIVKARVCRNGKWSEKIILNKKPKFNKLFIK